MAFGRRSFLLLGIGGSATVILGAAAGSSAASGDRVDVWRLSANWGYAVPPKGRTRCKCSACHDYAANMVFNSSSAAIANRLHPCCVCQPFSIEVSRTGFAALFAGSAVRADLRAPGVRTTFEAAINDLAADTPTTTTTDRTTPASVAAPATPDASSEQNPSAADGSTEPPQQDVLPVTGASASALLIGAAVLTAAGSAIVARTKPKDSAP